MRIYVVENNVGKWLNEPVANCEPLCEPRQYVEVSNIPVLPAKP